MKYGLYLIKLLFLGALIILHFKVIPPWFSVTLPPPKNPPLLKINLVTLKQPSVAQQTAQIIENKMIEIQQKQPIKSLIPAVSPQKSVKATPVLKVKKLQSVSPVAKVPNPPAPKIQKVQEKPLVPPVAPKTATVPITPPAVAKVAPVKREASPVSSPQPIPLKNVTPQEKIAVKPMTSQISTASTTLATAEKATIVNQVENRASATNSPTQTKKSSLQEISSGKSTISTTQKSTGSQPTQVYTPPNYRAAYLHNPEPYYPPLSRQLEEEGTVHLLVHLDARGQVRQVQLKSSCGYTRLDTAALQAVQHWQFVPAKQGDTPIAATTIVPITFRLSDG